MGSIGMWGMWCGSFGERRDFKADRGLARISRIKGVTVIRRIKADKSDDRRVGLEGGGFDLESGAVMTEPWLRGTLTHVDAVRRQVLHSLELAAEDVERWCAPLSDGEIEERPLGLPSVGFQLRHIARSLDRLLTYAEGQQLSRRQLKALRDGDRERVTRGHIHGVCQGDGGFGGSCVGDLCRTVMKRLAAWGGRCCRAPWAAYWCTVPNIRSGMWGRRLRRRRSWWGCGLEVDRYLALNVASVCSWRATISLGKGL